MKKQTFAVIGLGRFGGSVCKTLADAGQEVLAIDKYESRVNDYKDIATQAVVADAQDEDVLRSLGIRNVDHVIVAIGEDIQASILVTLMVKEQGVKYVTAKAQNEYHAKVLEKLGVDRVVHPERDMGVRIGRSLTSKNMVDYLDLDANFKLAEILITNPEFVGKSLAEMDFRDRYGLNVIALAHSRQEMVPHVRRDTVFLLSYLRFLCFPALRLAFACFFATSAFDGAGFFGKTTFLGGVFLSSSAICCLIFGRIALIINVCMQANTPPTKKYSPSPAGETKVITVIITGLMNIIICICLRCSLGMLSMEIHPCKA